MADRVGQQLGHYRLLRKIGQGSFAEVYLGEHLYLERPAAIKVLHVQIEPKTQERFRREARTIAHLQHPHIVQVLDFGIDDQTPYLVMEYTPGGTLRSHHPQGIRLPFEQIVTYVKQIASALDYAHQQRVIHRDIKPDNLLLNAKDEVVLSDFGLAVVQRSLDSLSMSNLAAGSPLYMAPEQIQTQSCAASDQYALGIMVYEWLAGEAPFRGTLFEVLSHHLHQPPPSLRERLPDLPVAVEGAVFKALAKDPEQRFACVTDFASALEGACFATQPFSLHGFPMQQAQGQMTFAAVPAGRGQADAFSTIQLAVLTGPQKEHGQGVVPLIAPLPVLSPTSSKQVKPSLAQSNRQHFLKRIRAFWIEGVLEHSLYGAAFIALGLQEQLDALANPWQLVLQHPNTAPRSFPLGTRITDVYNAANGELLILGAPGSGKTTLLLELARDLLDRAEHDEQHLIPVIFTLSSWTARQSRLTDWMVEELIDKYEVPRKLARAWVDTNQILPLLDGLDEVPAESRTACIETINTYHQEHAFLPLAVTSRSADYLTQTQRVRLTSAVTIQSLTQQQVDDYVAKGGESLSALRVALHQDATLRELTETPLMLSILTLTYHDMPVEELLRGGVAPTRQQVFEHYVERMLVHRGAKAQYRSEQTRSWLTWLVRQLIQHNQTVFYIEHMQMSWLPERWLHKVLPSLAVGVMYGLFVGLVFGYPYALIFSPSRGLLYGLVVGLFNTVIFTVLNGLVFGVLIERACDFCKASVPEGDHEGRPYISSRTDKTCRGDPRGRPARSTKDTRLLLQRKIVKSRIVYGFICGLLNVLAIGFLIGPLPGLIRGLFIGISYGLLGPLDREIRPTEVVTWSWVSVQRNITRFLGAGLLVGLLYGLVTSLFFGPSYLAHLLFGLIIGASVGLTLGLTSGLSNEKLNDRNRVMPNQGIWNSLWNSVFLGLLYGLVFGVIFGLIYGRILYLIFGSNYVTSFTINSGLVYGPTVGLSIAGAVWLYNGGTACTPHALLRVLLWFAKDIPWNYSHFLDYAAECILLRKVGGGYIFVHRLLLEYFMSLSPTRTSSQLVIEGTPAGQAGVCLCGCPYRPGARFCSNCGRPKKETNPEHVQDISLTQTGPLQN